MSDPTTVRSLLRYWRDGLADAERSHLRLSLEGTASCSRAEIAAGRLAPATTARLFGAASSRGSEARSVLLCPIHSRLRQERGYDVAGLPRQVNPLWIPALVDREGHLACPSGAAPWIPRFLLEPLPEGSLALGSIDSLDRFLTRHPPGEQAADWPAFWSFARELFASVVGQEVEAFSLPRYETLDAAYVLDQASPQGISRHLMALYDHLLQARSIPPLLARFASLDEVPGVPLLGAEDQARGSAHHLGQMQGRFPLSPSQRQALQHVLATGAGEMLAVQGPPGTGKTTLIQSVVASLWVEAAVAAGEPPILLVSSTNNQAVTNVIESFGRGGLDEESGGSLLAGRWLPGLGGYGLYCVSAARARSGHPELLPDGGGMPQEIESAPYLEASRAAYLERSSAYAGRELSTVEAAVAHLHRELLDAASEIAAGVAAWWERPRDEAEEGAARDRELATAARARAGELESRAAEVERARRLRLEWLHHLNGQPFWLDLLAFLPPVRRRIAWRHLEFFAVRGLAPPADAGDGRTILARFDAALAAAEAHRDELARLGAELAAEAAALAARRQAWESWRQAHPEASSPGSLLEDLDRSLRHRAFLLAARYWEGRWLLEREEEVRQGYEERQSVAKQRKRWRRYAKLTPCLVSTLHMVPRFFTAWEGREAPLYDFVDLLIVEEAGQVSPEVAAPVFALARRALAIGDRLQIEPVHTVPEPVDRANLERRGLASTPEGVERIADLGLSVSSGSVMVCAERASRFRRADGDGGVRLREHRRSVPEVIAYSNQLAYGGELIPLRPSLAGRIVPAMGYAQVPGRQEAAATSWKNLIEARVIAAWIDRHRRAIEGFYGEPLADILAVVTPFAAQTREIEAALARQGIRGLTVGTVHRLQGGERKVVIFSPVYDQTASPPYFFDRGVNLLNVAVSRARDSFLVFGEMSLFDEARPELPSGLLARYLFADEANELTGIEFPPRTGTTDRPVERLSSLAAHLDALRELESRLAPAPRR